VRLYWPVLAWSATLTLIYVQTWWAMFALRKHTEWSLLAGFVLYSGLLFSALNQV
jgi:hypothetical protein